MDAEGNNGKTKMKFRTVENLIRDVVSKRIKKSNYACMEHVARAILEKRAPPIEIDPEDQLTVGSYKTKHFEMSPDAQRVYSTLPKTTDPNKAEQAAILQDKLFALHKLIKVQNGATQDDVKQAKDIVGKINMLGGHMKIDHSYLDKNMKEITGLLGKQKDPENTLPKEPTGEIGKDYDIDQKGMLVSRSVKIQRKYKIIDDD